jgi:hypothetical protein
MTLGFTENKHLDIAPPASGKTKKQLYAEKKRERIKRRLATFVPHTPEFRRRVQRKIQAERRRDDCNYKGTISRLNALKEAYEFALEYYPQEHVGLSQEEVKLYFEVVDEYADLLAESEYEQTKQELEDLNQELDPNDYGD